MNGDDGSLSGIQRGREAAPETENPVPAIDAELMVTATVPLEVIVTDFDTAVPTATLPNDSEVAFKLKAAVAALSCSESAANCFRLRPSE